MKPEEIVVGGVYRVKGWARPRTVKSIFTNGMGRVMVHHHGPQNAWGITETQLKTFASWATERIDGENHE